MLFCDVGIIKLAGWQRALGIRRLDKVPLLPFMIIRGEQSSCYHSGLARLYYWNFLTEDVTLYGFRDLPFG